MSDELDRRLTFALEAARTAQELILRHFQSDDLAVDVKADASPVTIADRDAEQLLRQRIVDAFPHDAVWGEEFGETSGSSGCRWVLDPIDGTKAFVAGTPLFGTMLGLERDGECVLGVVRFPALDEVVYARLGGRCWRQRGAQPPRAQRVSPVAALRDALLCFTDVDGWVKVGRLEAFNRLCRCCRIARGWGDCYGHALVACGRVDVMVDPLLNPWDAAALVPIVTEAGGTFIDWTGRPTIHGGNGISSNGLLDSELLSILAAAPPDAG